MRKKFSLDAAALVEALSKEDVARGGDRPAGQHGRLEGPRVQASRAFVRNMARFTDLPFVFWDERLSTVAAERALIEMDVSRKKRAGRIDSAAASFILQGVLDRLQALGSKVRCEIARDSGAPNRKARSGGGKPITPKPRRNADTREQREKISAPCRAGPSVGLSC